MNLAPRCTAKAKSTGNRCGSPAVKGWNVCRMHGARGGAPEGKRNGNYRHGARTKEMMADMAVMQVLNRYWRQTQDSLKD